MTSMVSTDGAAEAAAAPPIRASDADRHETVQRLQEAVACGRLTTEEGGERMATAYAARYLHDLPPLTADLPPVAPPAPAAAGWRALLVMAVLQIRTTLTGSPTGGFRSRRAVVRTAGAVLALVVLLAVAFAALHGLVDGHHGPEGLPGR